MPRESVTVAEVALYEAGVHAGVARERERIEPLLRRAKWHARYGTRWMVRRLIEQALKSKEAADGAGE